MIRPGHPRPFISTMTDVFIDVNRRLTFSGGTTSIDRFSTISAGCSERCGNSNSACFYEAVAQGCVQTNIERQTN